MTRGLQGVALLLLCSGLCAAANPIERGSAPELLDFNELVTLSRIAHPGGALARKLDRLLSTPFIDNEAFFANRQPHRPIVAGLGPVIRTLLWNIERGLHYDSLVTVLSDPDLYLQCANPGSVEFAWAEYQARTAALSDIVILNEADFGMTRTNYRNVTQGLAAALRMNYAFGVEFVEVDPIHLGLERVRVTGPKADPALRQDLQVDRTSYRGLHGTAVLSRYPIRSARIIRLPECYDWYEGEKEAIAELEKGRRWSANQIFLERISREVRRGGRMATIVELTAPELPNRTLTVVATHLEDKCAPGCREQQMHSILEAIRDVRGPVILAGDLNTSGRNAAPTSVHRELMKRVKSPGFWASQLLWWFNPVAFPRYVAASGEYFKNYLDPTAPHIPVLAPNREAELFEDVKEFRFTDGGRFDFRGEAACNLKGRTGMLANSNQRGVKGFKPTFSFERDYGGLLGRYKLDWFFVKPAGAGNLCAPHFPLTMGKLNTLGRERISDHNPISVDLPLRESRGSQVR